MTGTASDSWFRVPVVERPAIALPNGRSPKPLSDSQLARSVFELLEKRCRPTPDKTVLSGLDRSLSYTETLGATTGLARRIASERKAAERSPCASSVASGPTT